MHIRRKKKVIEVQGLCGKITSSNNTTVLLPLFSISPRLNQSYDSFNTADILSSSIDIGDPSELGRAKHWGWLHEMRTDPRATAPNPQEQR
jgi:hypothetical protein